MHFRISSWLLIAFGAVSVLGTGQFISPPDATAGTSGTNLTYGVANTVEWNKVADYVVLSMGYGSYTNATITWFIANSINHDTSYTWTPRPDLDGFSDWETDLFYLLVVNSTNFGAPFTTNWFGIVKEVATTTSSLTTTQSTTTAATTATTLATTSATTTAAAAATPTTEGQGSGSQGLSSGAAAGVGVGVAAAVLIFAALVALFCWRKRKAARHADPVTPQDPSYHHDIAVDQVGGAKHDSSATHSADTYSGYYQQEPKYQLASTVDEGASVRYELDTGSGDRAELATHEHYR